MSDTPTPGKDWTSALSPAGLAALGKFAEHPSGLVVPEEISRVREIWTNPERKLLQRAFDLLDFYQIRIKIACKHPDCDDGGGRIVQSRNDQGERVWTCDHKVRTFRTRDR